MHYAILNSSGNALEWFEDEAEARRALGEMLAEFPDADVDLVAFEGPGRPVEPVTPSARSAWPAARLVWSSTATVTTTNAGNLDWLAATFTSKDLGERAENATDDRVEVEA